MIIDNNPILLDNSLEVEYSIKQDEEVSITVNGMMAIYKDDIISIIDNKIFLKADLDLDWNNDSFSIFYMKAL